MAVGVFTTMDYFFTQETGWQYRHKHSIIRQHIKRMFKMIRRSSVRKWRITNNHIELSFRIELQEIFVAYFKSFLLEYLAMQF
jgi:hypothetical protein